MTERAVPFYCPYCGDEDLRPAEDGPHGAWYCAACLRMFALKMIGIGVPSSASDDQRSTSDDLRSHRRAGGAAELRAAGRHGGRGQSSPGPPTTFGAPDDRGVQHAGRRAGRPRREGAARASRCCSWRPATTSPRRSAPATPSRRVYDVKIVNALPGTSVAEQDVAFGKDLFARDPDLCCACARSCRCTEPSRGYDAWVTGVRRVEAPTRANTPLVTYDDKRGLVKINPLAAWTRRATWRPTSPSTASWSTRWSRRATRRSAARRARAKPLPGADPRSGRWAGLAKTECGLHA